MVLTEYKETETMEMFKEESRVGGTKERQNEKVRQATMILLRIGKIMLEEITKSVGLSMADIQKIVQ